MGLNIGGKNISLPLRGLFRGVFFTKQKKKGHMVGDLVSSFVAYY
jgi:hypothetical protein